MYVVGVYLTVSLLLRLGCACLHTRDAGASSHGAGAAPRGVGAPPVRDACCCVLALTRPVLWRTRAVL